MTKVIYSLYIDIPEQLLVSHHNSKLAFNKHYDWLLSMHKQYANLLDIEYRHYTYDENYIEYQDWFRKTYPDISEYNIINFYKIYLLYELAKDYDEILYLDFDVVPITQKSFFDVWNISENGITIMVNRNSIDTSLHKMVISEKNFNNVSMLSNRSPTAKYWNARAMLIESNYSGINDVYNTGIIGASKKQLEQLDYWGEFNQVIELMTELKNDEFSMWPDHIRHMFGWDNETIWSYKMSINNIIRQDLTNQWHHVLDKWNYIPNDVHFVHVINKDFGYVKDWYEKNNL